ncbi:GvpL/GvpF family gas vesicle protein [Virgibacillus halophilus]|uniref:GvpL/GvpF family gas vesicle protein n=1 Tax=Tigheibacillus halophilus TaxID=361280 RepID=A0ABU5C5Y1_9BACI|nr:GvpL/GvpF family gas vesicle protein [Virgibacillus halophilus]
MEESFRLVKGNEEWNIKIYCDEDALKERVSGNSPHIEEKKKEMEKLPKGRQFF